MVDNVLPRRHILSAAAAGLTSAAIGTGAAAQTPSTKGAIRIRHQLIGSYPPDHPYLATLKKRSDRARQRGVIVDVEPLPSHGGGITWSKSIYELPWANAFVESRAFSVIADQAIDAERKGYDAMVIGSFSDQQVMEMRSLTDMAIVSVMESSLAVGMSLGRMVGIVGVGHAADDKNRESIARYKLGDRVVGLATVEPQPDLLRSVYLNPGKPVDGFKAAARKLIAMGAEVIIPGELPYALGIHEAGVIRVDDVPVVDVLATAWNWGELMARLRAEAGMTVARVGLLSQSDPAWFAAQKEKLGR